MDRTDGYAQTYADLLSAAKLHPLVADYQALRIAYAAAPEYDPYDARRDVAALYREVAQARRRGNAGRAIKFLDRLLEGNYLDARAHAIAASLHREMGDESGATYHRAFAQGIISAIRRSGDGKSVETAFVVISAQEEHAVLEALELQAMRQRRERVGERTFDVFDVRDLGTGQAGVRYFDVDLLVKGIQEGRAKLPPQRTKAPKRAAFGKQGATQDGYLGFCLATFMAMCALVFGLWFAEPPLIITGIVFLLFAVAVYRRLGFWTLGRTALITAGGALFGALSGVLTGDKGLSMVGAAAGGALGIVLGGMVQSAARKSPVGFVLGILVGMCLVVQGLRFTQYLLAISGGVLALTAAALYWRSGPWVGRMFLFMFCGALLGTLIGVVTGEIGRAIPGIVVGGALGAVLAGVIVVAGLSSAVPWPVALIIEARQAKQAKPKSPATCIVFVLAMIPGAYFGARELGQPASRIIGGVSGWAMVGGTIGVIVDILRMVTLGWVSRSRRE